MCGGRGGRSVAAMTYTTPIRSLAGAVIAILLCALAVAAVSAEAAGKKETLKIFSKVQSFTFTAADGTVSHDPHPAQAKPGDSFEIDSLDYRGTHKKHSKKPIGADYLRCTFGTRPRARLSRLHRAGQLAAPLPRFDLIGAIGKFKDARVLSNKEVPGGLDFVIRLTRR